MKTQTQLVLLFAALALGSGCATSTGGTADQEDTVYGADYYGHPGLTHSNFRGISRMEVWKQGSPSGNDPLESRPEFRFLYYR
jgi:hypothetical protein